jgi:predicted transcriptional regulator YheO
MNNNLEKQIFEATKKLFEKGLIKDMYLKSFCEYVGISRQTVYNCCKFDKISHVLRVKLNEINRQD